MKNQYTRTLERYLPRVLEYILDAEKDDFETWCKENDLDFQLERYDNTTQAYALAWRCRGALDFVELVAVDDSGDDESEGG